MLMLSNISFGLRINLLLLRGLLKPFCVRGIDDRFAGALLQAQSCRLRRFRSLAGDLRALLIPLRIFHN